MKIICSTSAALDKTAAQERYTGTIVLEMEGSPDGCLDGTSNRRFNFVVEEPLNPEALSLILTEVSPPENLREVVRLYGPLTAESFDLQVPAYRREGIRFLGFQVSQSVLLAKPQAHGGNVTFHTDPSFGLLIDGIKENPDSSASRRMELDGREGTNVYLAISSLG